MLRRGFRLRRSDHLELVRRQRKGRASRSGARRRRAAAPAAGDPITSNLYADSEKAALPAQAVAASLGCGNPAAFAELRPGETVLDLGPRGGIDGRLSARW